jgi:EAL domain-containing protein (putative c-di-GMP-specific phosphodiesterase class I)
MGNRHASTRISRLALLAATGTAALAAGAGLTALVEPLVVAGGALAVALVAGAFALSSGRPSQGGHTGEGWSACADCSRRTRSPAALSRALSQGAPAVESVVVIGLVRVSGTPGLRQATECELLAELEPLVSGEVLYRAPEDRLVLLSRRRGDELRPPLQALVDRVNRSLVGGLVAAGLDGDVEHRSLEEAFERADSAMREAASGRTGAVLAAGQVTRRDPLTHENVSKVRALLGGAGRIAVAYQPVIDLADGRVIGYEALMRPRDGRGPSPTVAFELAGRSGLAEALDRVCRLAVLSDAPGLDMRRDQLLFVNIAPQAFAHPDFDLLELATAAREAGLVAQQVVLEVRDEPAIDPRELAERAARARATGFRFALDDVGSPSSRLATLRLCRVDFLKVDGTLTAQGPGDSQARALYRALCAYAREVGCTLVAEGVENERLLQFVRGIGEQELQPPLVHAAQGYELGRPGPRPQPAPAAGAEIDGAGAG